jgi:tetratricopeptide (TPR) repeat protein
MKAVVSTFCLMLLAATSVVADDGGSESPFNLGTGARELSLGGTGVVTADAATAPYWNPSLLAEAQHLTAAGFYSRLFDSDVGYQYFGLAWPTLDFGTFGLGVFRLGVDGIEERDDNNLLLGEFSEQRLGLYAAYGRWMGNYRLGLSAHFEHHSLADRTATSSPGLTLALGRLLTTGAGRFRSGDVTVVFRNLVRPGMTLLDEKVNYPFRFDIGTRLVFAPTDNQDHLAALSAGLGKTDGNDPAASFGVEYQAYNILNLRGGWNVGEFSCGAGIDMGTVVFDYAFVERDMGTIHTFSLSTAIGASVDDRRTSREQKREEEFNKLMASSVLARNKSMIDDLMGLGQAALAAEDFGEASTSLDRALFLSRASGLDTTEVAALATVARNRLDQDLRDTRLQALLDSAVVKMQQNDMVGTSYYASLALGVDSSSSTARDLAARSDTALREQAMREETLNHQLYKVDSLVTYGRLDEAEALCRTLEQYAPQHPSLVIAIRRIQFEGWRRNAEASFAAGDLTRASDLADSVDQIYPGHEWLRTFRRRLSQAETGSAAQVAVTATSTPPELSSGARKEADAAYQEGQKAFASGDLVRATAAWERVERIAPDYRAAREYLIKAYKLTGIDLYGQNRLAEAVVVWQKALRLAPDNSEIAGYIARTRVEMTRLGALSNDH